MGRFIIFLLLSTLLLIIINIYLCKRYKKLAESYEVNIPEQTSTLVLFSGLLIFLSSLFLQNWIYRYRILALPVRYISSFYIGTLIYSFIFFLVGDIVEYLGNLIIPKNRIRYFFSRIYAKGLIVPAIAVMITLYGFYNAVNYEVTSYEIWINKRSSIPVLEIVMVSDLHVGTSVTEKQIVRIKKMVEELSPDIFFICGDIFDHDSNEEIMKFSADTLGSIKTPYGTYFVTGNHEYYLGEMSELLFYFDGTGIRVIQDEMVTIKDFYLAGRKDITERDRAPLSDILQNADKNRPIIVLDHQPNAIDEAIENGVDLQLSGHTHNGQIFPFNFLVGLANHTHYGLHEEGEFKAVVSSGAGTWKYPIRTGSSSEIVKVKVHFLKY